MDVRVIRSDELTSDHIDEWRRIQASRRSLQSPFFSPEFTLAVAGARNDAHVAVLTKNGIVSGFFPFHRVNSRIGKPIGAPIADYQGMIALASMSVNQNDLLEGCELLAYDFNHAPVDQDVLAPGSLHRSYSPHIDLTRGFDNWRATGDSTRKRVLKEATRRMRKMEKEIGPLRLELHDDSSQAWPTLVATKNAFYNRIGAPSIFEVPWAARTFQNIRSIRTPHFAGLLSTLYAGNRAVAWHFGMRSATTISWWLNSYDQTLHSFGPGISMIVLAAREANATGQTMIDLGRGDEAYKLRIASGATELCEGSIARSMSLPGVMRRFQRLSIQSFARLPLGRYDSVPRRALGRLLTSMRLPESGAAAQ